MFHGLCLGEYSMCPWKECMICCWWVECSIYACQVYSDDVFYFLVAILTSCFLHDWKGGVEVASCCCGIVSFCLHFYRFCFIILRLLLGVCVFIIVTSSNGLMLFSLKMLFLFPVKIFILKSIHIATLVFFLLLIVGCIFPYPFVFIPFMSLSLNCVSYAACNWIIWKIHSANLCLLTRDFYLLTLNDNTEDRI